MKIRRRGQRRENKNEKCSKPDLEFTMRTTNRRLISGLLGGLVFLITLFEGYFQSFGFYQEHYVWPREKYGVVTPLRWQDIAFLAVFWFVAIMLFYGSFRLLRYAFRRTPG